MTMPIKITHGVALIPFMALHFLFSNNFVLLAYIYLGLKDIKNPLVMVLVETLSGLDEVDA